MYCVQKLIGSGAYGEVYKGVELDARNEGEDDGRSQRRHTVRQHVAIKRIAFDLIPEEVEDVMKEVAFLSTAVHPNIVQCFHSFLTPLPDQHSVKIVTAAADGARQASSAGHLVVGNINPRAGDGGGGGGGKVDLLNDGINSVCLVEEWVTGGSISDMFIAHTRFSEEEIQAVALDVVKALTYLHQDSYLVHRDLKCSNLLVDVAKGVVKLSDFGACGKVEGYSASRFTLIGTPGWMAPEITSRISMPQDGAGGGGGESRSGTSPSASRRFGASSGLDGGAGAGNAGGGHGFATDIWSLGVTLLEMVFGGPPNADYTFTQTLNRISGTSIPAQVPSIDESVVASSSEPIVFQHGHNNDYSALMKDFVARCLRRDPKQRLSAAALLQHPFLKNVKPNETRKILKGFRGYVRGGVSMLPLEEDEGEGNEEAFSGDRQNPVVTSLADKQSDQRHQSMTQLYSSMSSQQQSGGLGSTYGGTAGTPEATSIVVTSGSGSEGGGASQQRQQLDGDYQIEKTNWFFDKKFADALLPHEVGLSRTGSLAAGATPSSLTRGGLTPPSTGVTPRSLANAKQSHSSPHHDADSRFHGLIVKSVETTLQQHRELLQGAATGPYSGTGILSSSPPGKETVVPKLTNEEATKVMGKMLHHMKKAQKAQSQFVDKFLDSTVSRMEENSKEVRNVCAGLSVATQLNQAKPRPLNLHTTCNAKGSHDQLRDGRGNPTSQVGNSAGPADATTVSAASFPLHRMQEQVGRAEQDESSADATAVLFNQWREGRQGTK